MALKCLLFHKVFRNKNGDSLLTVEVKRVHLKLDLIQKILIQISLNKYNKFKKIKCGFIKNHETFVFFVNLSRNVT